MNKVSGKDEGILEGREGNRARETSREGGGRERRTGIMGQRKEGN